MSEQAKRKNYPQTVRIRITDLHLRTIIGVYDWEREIRQDVIINVTMDCQAGEAITQDKFEKAVDYKAITKAIIQKVEDSSYFLLERLAAETLAIVMDDPGVLSATVKVDKPEALRFARSVSAEVSAQRHLI